MRKRPEGARITTAAFETEPAVLEGAAGARLLGLSANAPKLRELDIADIDPNPDQARKVFDEEQLQELVASIRRHGLQTPILVQRQPTGRYQIIGGERRYRAHKLLGLDRIFALLVEGNADEIGLIDNIQRVGLTSVEMARGFQSLKDKYNYTNEELGAAVGQSVQNVGNILAILRLPKEILDEYPEHHQNVSRRVLIDIARVDDPEVQRKLWSAAKGGATVKDVQAARRQQTAPKSNDAHALRAVGTILKKTDKEVERLRTEYRSTLADVHREQLRALRSKIDELLGDDQ